MRQQRLVGRDDVLAGPEHFDLNLLGDPGPADEFDADPDGRIVQQAIQIGGEHPRRQLNRARPRRVGVNDARQLRTHAHLGGDDIGIFENQLGHAGADRRTQPLPLVRLSSTVLTQAAFVVTVGAPTTRSVP